MIPCFFVFFCIFVFFWYSKPKKYLGAECFFVFLKTCYIYILNKVYGNSISFERDNSKKDPVFRLILFLSIWTFLSMQRVTNSYLIAASLTCHSFAWPTAKAHVIFYTGIGFCLKTTFRALKISWD